MIEADETIVLVILGAVLTQNLYSLNLIGFIAGFFYKILLPPAELVVIYL
ncbi:MAG: hypothetical protein K2O18_03275 [Oscillospiraceae bacterium]|nr:hypothetical protein [Oscillospiraceae bacterium]